MDNDITLAARAAHGDREAFDELVTRHHPRTHALIRAATGGDPESEDLLQETFVRAYRAVRAFRGESSFRTWLHRIAINVVRSHVDRRRRTPSALVIPNGEERAFQLEWMPSLDDVETAVVQRQMITQALATLDDDVRRILILREIEGFEYHEIAAVTGLPIGTVESRVFRARRRLRRLLAGLRSHASAERDQ